MKRRIAELILLLIVFASSLVFLLTRLGGGQMEPFNLITLCFLIAFLGMVVICRKKL